MSWDLEKSRNDYELEKEARKKRLTAYADAIQKQTLKKTSEMIEQLVEERRSRICQILQEYCRRILQDWKVGIEFRRWSYYKNMHRR